MSGDYTIENLIKDDDKNLVYKAKSSSDGRLVIVNILKRNYDVSKSFAEQGFAQDNVIYQKIEHANIAHFIFYKNKENKIFYSIEYLQEGKILFDFIKEDNVFHFHDVCSLCSNLMQAISYLDMRYPLVTCEINPQNIIYNKTLNLINLSCARNLVYDFDKVSLDEINFIAPEFFDNQLSIDYQKSTIYSLGVLFYYMVSGKYPFKGTTKDEIENNKKAFNYVPLVDLNEDIPNVFSKLIDLMLYPFPNKRNLTFEEIRNTLFNISKRFSKAKELNSRIKQTTKNVINLD